MDMGLCPALFLENRIVLLIRDGFTIEGVTKVLHFEVLGFEKKLEFEIDIRFGFGNRLLLQLNFDFKALHEGFGSS